MQAHGVSWDDIAGKIAMNSGLDHHLKLLDRGKQSGALRKTEAYHEVVQFIKDNGIGVLILDPLQELHDGSENDNGEMKNVAVALRSIAWETNCAVMVVHHTRKSSGDKSDGHAGNMDSGRGASSQQGVSRIYLTMDTMTEKDAETLGVNPDRRFMFAQVDCAKNNLGVSGERQWLRRISVPLGRPELGNKQNVEGVDYVGALAPVDLSPDRTCPITVADLNSVWGTASNEKTVGELARRLIELPMLQDNSLERLADKIVSLAKTQPRFDQWQFDIDNYKDREVLGLGFPIHRQKRKEPAQKPALDANQIFDVS